MTPVKDSAQQLHGGQHGQAFPKPRADINVMSTEWGLRDYKMASWAHYALTPYVPFTADKACSCTYSFISSYLPFASMNQTMCLGLRHRNVQGSAPTCHVGQRDEDESIPHPLCRPWSPLPGRQSCTHHLPSHFPQHIAPSSPLPTILCVQPPHLFSAALPGGNAFPLSSKMAASGGSRQGGPSWCCQKKIASNSRY